MNTKSIKRTKRTSTMNKSRFRKVPTTIKYYKVSLLFLIIGSTFVLSGCDYFNKEDTQLNVYNSVQSCQQQANTIDLKNKCNTDYKNALAKNESVAPKFNSQKDCEQQYGTSQCTNSNTNNINTGSTYWIPLMQGFSSSYGSYSSQPLYSSKQPQSQMYNKFVDAKGNSFGRYGTSGVASIHESTFHSTSSHSSTSVRGGFGSTASSHASVGHASVGG